MRFITFALSLLAAGTLAAQSAPSYRITQTYTLGGDGRWDYITPDAPNHRVFIGRQNRVMVVDTENGKLLGEIAPVDGAHGVALVDQPGTDSPPPATTGRSSCST